MATKRNPEERSPRGPGMPDEGAAHPTGQEVSEEAEAPRAASARQGRDTDAQAAGKGAGAIIGTAAAEAGDGAESSPEGSAEGSTDGSAPETDLQALASEYYGRLADTAGRLNEQVRSVYGTGVGYARSHPRSLFLGGFALGVLIGVLTRRR